MTLYIPPLGDQGKDIFRNKLSASAFFRGFSPSARGGGGGGGGGGGRTAAGDSGALILGGELKEGEVGLESLSVRVEELAGCG